MFLTMIKPPPLIRRLGPLFVIFLSGISGLVCLSCEDELTGTGVSDVVFPDSGVSYAQHVDLLFQQSCVSTLCHGGADPASQLNLEFPSYRALIDHSPRLVLAGDAANSLLILRLIGEVGERMPLRQKPLTDNQINGIQTWINEGAINN